jgi:hypothetical protein
MRLRLPEGSCAGIDKVRFDASGVDPSSPSPSPPAPVKLNPSLRACRLKRGPAANSRLQSQGLSSQAWRELHSGGHPAPSHAFESGLATGRGPAPPETRFFPSPACRHSARVNSKIDVLARECCFRSRQNVLQLLHGKGKKFDAIRTCQPENARRASGAFTNHCLPGPE